MKIVLFILAAALGIPRSNGQSPELLRLKPDEEPADAAWKDGMYRFPQFEKGRIYYIKGISSTYKLNYNLFFEEMDFINQNGDTLTLNNKMDVRLVSVGGHVFYNDPRMGYIEILMQAPLALGMKKMLKLTRHEVVLDNGYGLSAETTGSVSSFRRYSRHFTSNFDKLYKKDSIYFFIDQKNRLHAAKKSSILRLFPDNSDIIRSYIAENRINFKKEQDLQHLLHFCSQFATTY